MLDQPGVRKDVEGEPFFDFFAPTIAHFLLLGLTLGLNYDGKNLHFWWHCEQNDDNDHARGIKRLQWPTNG